MQKSEHWHKFSQDTEHSFKRCNKKTTTFILSDTLKWFPPRSFSPSVKYTATIAQKHRKFFRESYISENLFIVNLKDICADIIKQC